MPLIEKRRFFATAKTVRIVEYESGTGKMKGKSSSPPRRPSRFPAIGARAVCINFTQFTKNLR